MSTKHYVGAIVLLVVGYFVGVKYPNFWQGVSTGA
jgi:hypothetical protein